MGKEPNNRLRITLKHSKPVEINEFTISLNSVANLYSSYMQDNGICNEMAQAKLYIEKIEKGSIIVDLMEIVSGTILPYAENVNTIIDFAGHLKSVFDFFIYGRGKKPELTISECQDFNNTLSVVSGDNAGTLDISAVDTNNGTIYNGCTFNYVDSNAGQNQFKKEIERLKSIAPKSEIYSKQLMTIYQMRGDMSNDKGNRAIIQGISNNKLTLLFDTDKLKEQILNMDSNPVKKGFVVDVEVLIANNKIQAYKVLALHETIDLE